MVGPGLAVDLGESIVSAMSALGYKRTFAPQNATSALSPKADMCGATTNVCFGPEADIAARTSVAREVVIEPFVLFEHYRRQPFHLAK